MVPCVNWEPVLPLGGCSLPSRTPSPNQLVVWIAGWLSVPLTSSAIYNTHSQGCGRYARQIWPSQGYEEGEDGSGKVGQWRGEEVGGVS